MEGFRAIELLLILVFGPLLAYTFVTLVLCVVKCKFGKQNRVPIAVSLIFGLWYAALTYNFLPGAKGQYGWWHLAFIIPTMLFMAFVASCAMDKKGISPESVILMHAMISIILCVCIYTNLHKKNF